jgi:methylated-DNA-[protein]-cysteine S-methyltransferase
MAHPIVDLFQCRMSSPIGTIVMLIDGRDRLSALDFEDDRSRMEQLLNRHYGVAGWHISEAKTEPSAAPAIERYFAGDLAALESIATHCGGTDFQRIVWTALRTIEPGTTRSYAALARQIGRPAATRAVGAANGANPIGIVVPCHRVIGADGSLTGFGGGIERKRWLLNHENNHCRT